MELFQRQIIQEKDMFLKKNSFVIIVFFNLLILGNSVIAKDNLTNKAIDYLERLNFFSASFIQDDGLSISEGKFFIGMDRIRVEYDTPSKILIILDKDKAMYYNYELDEDEFFNPQNTSAWFFFDIFNNPDFFSDSVTNSADNYFVLKKEIINELGQHKIIVYFENNPFLIRKIEIISDEVMLNISVFNHNHNENFNKNFFKLINPLFFEN